MYIFVGNFSEVDGVVYDRIGQQLQASDERAHELVTKENVAALPEEDFKAIGFTDEELHPRKGYAMQGRRVIGDADRVCRAPAEFMAKHTRALTRVHEIREDAAKAA